MVKTIIIDGAGRLFKTSGFTPRIYRAVTGRDLLRDIGKLETIDPDQPTPVEILTIYEDLAYTMAKQGNDSLPDDDERKITPFPETPDEWLDGIEALSIYDVLPQIAQMWRESNQTLIESKKKGVAAGN